MGCGASVQTARRKYQFGPLETPQGDAVAPDLKPPRSAPALAPLEVAALAPESKSPGTTDGKFSKIDATTADDTAERSAADVTKSPSKDAAKSPSKEKALIEVGSPQRKVDVDAATSPVDARRRDTPVDLLPSLKPPVPSNPTPPAPSAPLPPTEAPPAWRAAISPVRTDNVPTQASANAPVVRRNSAPVGTVSGPGKLARPGVIPTLHSGVEALVERQSAVTVDLQTELRRAEKEVKGNANALRALWKEIGQRRVTACALEHEVAAVLSEQLIKPGPLRDEFESQCAKMVSLKAELSVETEKGTRWLALARGLQGKMDTLILEGLMEAISPAGILFSPMLGRREMDNESDMSARGPMMPQLASMSPF
jgi:hypothetical protein